MLDHAFLHQHFWCGRACLLAWSRAAAIRCFFFVLTTHLQLFHSHNEMMSLVHDQTLYKAVEQRVQIPAGHAFYKVGLAPCNLATAAATLGSKLTVPFIVYNDGSPPLQASVNRTLLVVSPCAEGVLLLQSVLWFCMQEA